MIYDAVIDTYAGLIAEEDLRNRPVNLSIRQWVQCIPHLLKIMERAEGGNPQNLEMHRQLCLRVGEKLIPAVTAVLEQAQARKEISIADCRETAIFGIYGEIGLLLSLGPNCGDAIQRNWHRLLGL